MDLIRSLTDHWLSPALGALLVVVAAHFLNVGRTDLAQRRSAAQRIREAFNPELDALLQNRAAGTNEVLTDSALRRHQTALNTEVGNLSFWRRLRVQFAWKRLAFYKGHGPSYSHYFDAGSMNDRPYLVRFAIERIRAVVNAAGR